MEDTRSRDTTSRTLSTTSGRGWSRRIPRVRFSGTGPTARTCSIRTENSTRSNRLAMEDSSQPAQPNQFNGGDSSLWLVKTDSNGNIAGCNDVQTRSDVSGAVSVTVSTSDMKATPDSFVYVLDTLSSLPGPLKATKEC